jgi:hypothetical protein
MKSKIIVPVLAVVLLAAGTVFLINRSKSSSPGTKQVTPTPTPEQVEQLSAEKQPKVSLAFTADGHFVTVKFSHLYAASLEYNLIYDTVVKKTKIQSGVTGSAQLSGASEYSNKQLLGSESSGKFTYHENISNAILELTLRNSSGYSIFSATYPFTVSPGKTVELTVAE